MKKEVSHTGSISWQIYARLLQNNNPPQDSQEYKAKKHIKRSSIVDNYYHKYEAM